MKRFMDLKVARQSLGFSQQRLSELAGVTPLTICNIEKGRSMPTVGTRRKLEEAMGLRINWLSGSGGRRIVKGDRATYPAMEQKLRELIFDINYLDPQEQSEFVALAKLYINAAETNRQNKEEIENAV